ncbi:unnamed protein product [Kluyveromyces dobzhanskii CBS 2104]|uniref:WGS project CCBQ000000000 data, contig 00051 n=1 Tax=Kluyveromyces dobzhanskii CBS 2104 TaxID=1427455 RepID=A0A0A8L7E3_9SACH|nr:unnamed protein product [Kluyveromyces dobzhanskii CBS 2104]
MLDQTTLDTLLTHAKQNGCEISDGIEFRIDPSTGVGGYITKVIPEHHKPLIKIPKDFIITRNDAMRHFKSNRCSSSNPNAITQMYLIALRNSNSTKWQPYLNILPSLDNISSPLIWKHNELEVLRGSDLYIKSKRKLKDLLDEWYTVLKELDLCNTAATEYYQLQDRENIVIQESYAIDSFAAYLWASLIFSSRAFPSLVYDSAATFNEAFLFPIVDLLNHSDDSKVFWRFAESFLTFTSEESLKVGDELYNNYGSKSNEDLLLGYGFAHDPNPYDLTSISLKLDDHTIKSAQEYGIEMDLNSISGDSIRFDISTQDPLPLKLIMFFGYISKLKSERDITVRAVVEGLGQLQAILAQKVSIFKEKSKFAPNTYDITDPLIIKNAKTYLTAQRKLFHLSEDTLVKKVKAIIKVFKPLSFKSIFKAEHEFANSLQLSLGISNYEELVSKGLTQHALLLWIVKIHNFNPLKKSPAYSFVYRAFGDVKNNIKIEKDDVMEYMNFYKTFFPTLSLKFPKIYGVGSWSISDFIVAGVVMDRLVWLRKSNSDYLFFEKQSFDGKMFA